MTENVELFFSEVEDATNPSRANEIEEFFDSVKQVYFDVLEGGFSRIDLLIDADDESLNLYLRDDEEIAEYELFTLHSTGHIDPHFLLETVDYHKDTIGFRELEDNPTHWFESRFDDTDEIPFDTFKEHQQAFLDELSECMTNFCTDLETVYQTDDELEILEKHMDFDRSELQAEDKIREKF